MSHHRLDRLVSATRRTIKSGLEDPSADAPLLERALTALDTAEASSSHEDSKRVEASDWVRSALDFAGPSPASELAAAIADAANNLSWTVPYLDYDEPDIVSLRNDYLVATLVGTDARSSAHLHSDVASIFFSVQRPNVFYPSHVHKAAEIYYPVAGTAMWTKGAESPTPQTPGTWINHPTGTCHAMETLTEPLLCLAIWTTDLSSIPVIVRA